MTAVLGPKPPAERAEVEDFAERIVARGGPALVLNDEAHHTHDEDSEWNKVIRRLHAERARRAGGPARFLGHAALQQGRARSPGPSTTTRSSRRSSTASSSAR